MARTSQHLKKLVPPTVRKTLREVANAAMPRQGTRSGAPATPDSEGNSAGVGEVPAARLRAVDAFVLDSGVLHMRLQLPPEIKPSREMVVSLLSAGGGDKTFLLFSWTGRPV